MIDTTTNTVTATIAVGAEPRVWRSAPTAPAPTSPAAPDGTVSVIDTATNTVTATIPVGRAPSDLAVSPDGTRAYVTTYLGTVSVIDTATNAVVMTVPSAPPRKTLRSAPTAPVPTSHSRMSAPFR